MGAETPVDHSHNVDDLHHETVTTPIAKRAPRARTRMRVPESGEATAWICTRGKNKVTQKNNQSSFQTRLLNIVPLNEHAIH